MKEVLLKIISECHAYQNGQNITDYLDASTTYETLDEHAKTDVMCILTPEFEKDPNNLYKSIQNANPPTFSNLLKNLNLPKMDIAPGSAKLMRCPACREYTNFSGITIDQTFTCKHCFQLIIGHRGFIVYPKVKYGEDLPQNKNISQDTQNLYDEARSTFQDSHRSAALLLRTFIENTLTELGYKGGPNELLNVKVMECCKDPKFNGLKNLCDSIRWTANDVAHKGVAADDVFPSWSKNETEAVFDICYYIFDTLAQNEKIDETAQKLNTLHAVRKITKIPKKPKPKMKGLTNE